MDYSPIWISLKTASIAMFFTFFLGIYAARLVMRVRCRGVKLLLDGLFILPLVLPPTVAGFFLLYLLGNQSLLGGWFYELTGKHIAFSFGATVIAAVLISFPLMYRSAKVAFEQVDEELIQVARIYGLGRTRIFYQVLLPNALPGVVSGAVLSFARGLGEFGATIMIAGNIAGKTRTLPMAIYSKAAAGQERQAFVYVCVIMGICLFVVFGMNMYLMIKQKKE